MAKMVIKARQGELNQDYGAFQNLVYDKLAPHVVYDADIKENVLEHFSNPELAISLSGTSDKKSKEYKAAIRRVQKWRAGQQSPGARYQESLVEVARHKRLLPASSLKEALGGPGVPKKAHVTLRGYVVISATPAEYRTLHADIEDMEGFLEHLIDGEEQEALEQFADDGAYPYFSLYGSASDHIDISY